MPESSPKVDIRYTLSMQIPTILKTISKQLSSRGAQAVVVGGSVRDYFLQLPIKDYDIEVYGLETLEMLEEILSGYGSVNLVGKQFGVLKFVHEGEVYDFSFPRQEEKVGAGHKGFEVTTDGMLSYREASKRRDFTMNALGYSIESRVFLDPFGGRADMQAKKIRHIDDATFIEDPLRVYRAVQFCARFDYTLAEETLLLCRQMVAQGMLEELPKERVYAEWQKLLLLSPEPSVGFELMRDLGIIERYFPELHALIGVPQSPRWHPEGDVWIHTMMAIDAMAKLCRSDSSVQKKEQCLELMFAVLCHDLGKATHTTVEEDGRIRAIGHEEAGVLPTKNLLYRLTDEHDFIASILPLVRHHLKPSQFYRDRAKAGAFRRLATEVTIETLVIVAKADFLGRTTEEAKEGVYPAGAWMLEISKALNVSEKPPKPLLRGKDLITLGLDPSPQFKKILNRVYMLQLEGSVQSREEALHAAKECMLGRP